MTASRCFSRPARVAAALLVALGVLTAEGCSSKSKVDIAGKVTYKGQPVRPGNVQFFDAQGTILSNASLHADGTFTATDLPPGEVQVAVRVLPGVGIATKDGDAVDDAKRPGKAVAIPRKYEDPKTSGLHYTVEGGTNELAISLQ